MGQYSQWLRYQEVDQRLRAELEALKTELTQLEDEMHLFEASFKQPFPQPDNPILRSLTTNLNKEAPSSNGFVKEPPVPGFYSPASPTNNLPQQVQRSTHATLAQSSETISHALLGWAALPDFRPQEMETPALDTQQVIPATPHLEIALLPEDMPAFFDEHTQTEPQLELPWWLRNMIMNSSANNTSSTGDHIDPESIRTNRLIQRWIERWRRPSVPSSQAQHPSSPQKPEEDVHEK